MLTMIVVEKLPSEVDVVEDHEPPKVLLEGASHNCVISSNLLVLIANQVLSMLVLNVLGFLASIL
jgi:hypothetical protein